VPLQFAVRALERGDAARVEVVPFAIGAVVLLRRVAGRPVDHVELGIVAAGEPGRRAAVLDVLASPGFRTRLPRPGHGPEPQDILAGLLFVRGEDTVGAVV